jgi:hypothetical protein
MSRHINCTTLTHPQTVATLTESGGKGEEVWTRDESQDQHLIWQAKLFIVGKIAAGETILTPPQIMALNLYTSSAELSQTVNEAILQQRYLIDQKVCFRLHSLFEAVEAVPPFPDYTEIFVGSDRVQRLLFQVGTEVSWTVYLSGSTMWPVATDNLEDFTKKGTVFIIKTKTARLVSPYSSFSYDGEVVILPHTRFRVTSWLKGDVIALGQANIRQNSYGMTEEERAKWGSNEKPLIIELIEC